MSITKEYSQVIDLVDTEFFNKTTGELTIPEGITELRAEFYYKREDINKLNKIKKIKLAKSVNKIGKYAFRRTGIVKIELTENVKEIELGAFEMCTNLYEVSINGNNVPIVEKDSFLACNNLERFYNDNGDINITEDFRISNKAFSTSKKLLQNKSTWMIVVDEKQLKMKKYINLIKISIKKLLKLENKENVYDEF